MSFLSFLMKTKTAAVLKPEGKITISEVKTKLFCRIAILRSNLYVKLHLRLIHHNTTISRIFENKESNQISELKLVVMPRNEKCE